MVICFPNKTDFFCIPSQVGHWIKMLRNFQHITGWHHQTQDEKFDISKARSATYSECPGRLGSSLVVVSITDQHLRKAIGRTIMHSDVSLLPLVIGGPCPQLSARCCFAGICATENQAIYREHSSLRSSYLPQGAKYLKISSWSLWCVCASNLKAFEVVLPLSQGRV